MVLSSSSRYDDKGQLYPNRKESNNKMRGDMMMKDMKKADRLIKKVWEDRCIEKWARSGIGMMINRIKHDIKVEESIRRDNINKEHHIIMLDNIISSSSKGNPLLPPLVKSANTPLSFMKDLSLISSMVDIKQRGVIDDIINRIRLQQRERTSLSKKDMLGKKTSIKSDGKMTEEDEQQQQQQQEEEEEQYDDDNNEEEQHYIENISVIKDTYNKGRSSMMKEKWMQHHQRVYKHDNNNGDNLVMKISINDDDDDESMVFNKCDWWNHLQNDPSMRSRLLKERISRLRLMRIAKEAYMMKHASMVNNIILNLINIAYSYHHHHATQEGESSSTTTTITRRMSIGQWCKDHHHKFIMHANHNDEDDGKTLAVAAAAAPEQQQQQHRQSKVDEKYYDEHMPSTTNTTTTSSIIINDLLHHNNDDDDDDDDVHHPMIMDYLLHRVGGYTCNKTINTIAGDTVNDILQRRRFHKGYNDDDEDFKFIMMIVMDDVYNDSISQLSSMVVEDNMVHILDIHEYITKDDGHNHHHNDDDDPYKYIQKACTNIMHNTTTTTTSSSSSMDHPNNPVIIIIMTPSDMMKIESMTDGNHDMYTIIQSIEASLSSIVINDKDYINDNTRKEVCRYILPPSMTMIVDNYDILLPTTTLKAVVKVYNNDNGDYEDIIFKEVMGIPIVENISIDNEKEEKEEEEHIDKMMIIPQIIKSISMRMVSSENHHHHYQQHQQEEEEDDRCIHHREFSNDITLLQQQQQQQQLIIHKLIDKIFISYLVTLNNVLKNMKHWMEYTIIHQVSDLKYQFLMRMEEYDDLNEGECNRMSMMMIRRDDHTAWMDITIPTYKRMLDEYRRIKDSIIPDLICQWRNTIYTFGRDLAFNELRRSLHVVKCTITILNMHHENGTIEEEEGEEKDGGGDDGGGGGIYKDILDASLRRDPNTCDDEDESIITMILNIYDRQQYIEDTYEEEVSILEREVLENKLEYINYLMMGHYRDKVVKDLTTQLLQDLDHAIKDYINNNNNNTGDMEDYNDDDDDHPPPHHHNHEEKDEEEKMEVHIDNPMHDVITYLMSVSFSHNKDAWLDPMEVYRVWAANLYKARYLLLPPITTLDCCYDDDDSIRRNRRTLSILSQWSSNIPNNNIKVLFINNILSCCYPLSPLTSTHTLMDGIAAFITLLIHLCGGGGACRPPTTTNMVYPIALASQQQQQQHIECITTHTTSPPPLPPPPPRRLSNNDLVHIISDLWKTSSSDNDDNTPLPQWAIQLWIEYLSTSLEHIADVTPIKMRSDITQEWIKRKKSLQEEASKRQSQFLLGRQQQQQQYNKNCGKVSKDDDDDDDEEFAVAHNIMNPSYRNNEMILSSRNPPLLPYAFFYLACLNPSLSDSLKDLIHTFGDIFLITSNEEEDEDEGEEEEKEAITILSIYDIVYGIGYLLPFPPPPTTTTTADDYPNIPPPLSHFVAAVDDISFDHHIPPLNPTNDYAVGEKVLGSPEDSSQQQKIPQTAACVRCMWVKDALEVLLNPESVLRCGDLPLVVLLHIS